MSTKERLKKLQSVTAVEIAGNTFHVRALTLGELEGIDRDMGTFVGIPDAERKVGYARRLLAAAVCEADGQPVFSGHADPDIDHVNTEALRTLTDSAAEANGISGGEQGND